MNANPPPVPPTSQDDCKHVRRRWGHNAATMEMQLHCRDCFKMLESIADEALPRKSRPAVDALRSVKP